MNTTENNKIIAEFLEWKFKPKFDCYVVPFNYVDYLDGTPFINKICHVENLQFNSDWNWLMVVVEKIESLHESNNVLIGTNITYVQIHNKVRNEQETFKGVADTKNEAVYNACVTFIEWYNKQK